MHGREGRQGIQHSTLTPVSEYWKRETILLVVFQGALCVKRASRGPSGAEIAGDDSLSLCPY